MPYKGLITYFAALIVTALGISAFVVFDNPREHSANIADALPTPELLCENHDEMEDFQEPVSVVWTAKLDGCLASCEGASFTRIPEDSQYPRFAGYSPELLEADIWQSNDILEVHGDWVGVGADHPFTVFDNKCVPIVRINKIVPSDDRGQD